MASIEKRGDSYRVVVFAGRDEKGRQVKKSTTYTPTAKTPKAIEKEVAAFAANFEKRVLEGDVYDDKTKFSVVWKMFSEAVLPQKSVRTQDSYKSDMEKRFLPALGHLAVGKIRAPHIDAIISQMKAEGKAAKTIRSNFYELQNVFNYAYKKGMIKENPCSRCDDLPSIERDGELHYWSVEQAKTFFEALELEYPVEYKARKRHLESGNYDVAGYTATHTIPYQWRPYFAIAIYGGFRRGEIIALTWKDIDFERHTVTINKAVTHTTATGDVLKTPKTKAGVREIVLPAVCFELLKKWKAQQMELALRLGTAWTGKRGRNYDENNIFIKLEDGSRMYSDTPTHKFREVCDMYNSTYAKTEDDKLPYIRLHDLRHTSATLLLGNGADIETVSKRLGHSKASITLDIYGHAMPERDKSASDKLEELFA